MILDRRFICIKLVWFETRQLPWTCGNIGPHRGMQTVRLIGYGSSLGNRFNRYENLYSSQQLITHNFRCDAWWYLWSSGLHVFDTWQSTKWHCPSKMGPHSCFYNCTSGTNCREQVLTNWGRDKMDAISKTPFSSTFSCIFLNENVWIPIKISLKFVPKGRINNVPALVQIMAWRRPGDKPLSEPMMVSLPTHICVTRPQWVNRWK